MNRLLIVEDDADLRELVAQIAVDLGHQVEAAGSLREALACLAGAEPFDLVLTDFRFPDGDGLSVAQAARERSRRTRVVLLTGDRAQMTPGDPRAEAVSLWLDKPIDLASLERALSDQLRRLTS